jgi:hypothetical protein
LSPARNRTELWARAAFVAAVITHLLVLYWPRQVSDGGIPHTDKIVHVGIFALVVIAGARAGVRLSWLVGLLAVHAVGSELVQHWFLANRSGDPADVAADLVGVAVGAVAAVKMGGTGVASTRSGGSLSS